MERTAKLVEGKNDGQETSATHGSYKFRAALTLWEQDDVTCEVVAVSPPKAAYGKVLALTPATLEAAKLEYTPRTAGWWLHKAETLADCATQT